MLIEPHPGALAMLAVGCLTVLNAAGTDQFCIVHNYSPTCENPPEGPRSRISARTSRASQWSLGTVICYSVFKRQRNNWTGWCDYTVTILNSR